MPSLFALQLFVVLLVDAFNRTEYTGKTTTCRSNLCRRWRIICCILGQECNYTLVGRKKTELIKLQLFSIRYPRLLVLSGRGRRCNSLDRIAHKVGEIEETFSAKTFQYNSPLSWQNFLSSSDDNCFNQLLADNWVYV